MEKGDSAHLLEFGLRPSSTLTKLSCKRIAAQVLIELLKPYL